jgi:hypothetical protein
MADTVGTRAATPRARILLFLSAALLGAALMLSAWQGYRYERLLHTVSALEREQRHWHERNKQALADLTGLRSPQRVDAAAAQQGLQRMAPERRLLVRFALPEPPPGAGQEP